MPKIEHDKIPYCNLPQNSFCLIATVLVLLIISPFFIDTILNNHHYSYGALAFVSSGLNQSKATPFSSSEAQLLARESKEIESIFNQTKNSVVQIASTNSSSGQTNSNGVPQTRRSTALGSGFVYDNEGHIVTSYNVISNSTKVDVTFTDGNSYPASIVGKDLYLNLAVLQITGDYSEEKGVVPLLLANSSSVKPGEQIITIGNPFGLSSTITTDTVGQKGRLLPNPHTGFTIPDTIQTDAPLHAGDAGAPLLNINGEIIGMYIAQYGVDSGMGFAIPSNTLAKETPLLIKNGGYDHPWLGFSGTKVTPDLIRNMGLPSNYKGVVVSSVQPGSPAEKAGLIRLTQDVNGTIRMGDIITAIDRHPVRQVNDIINYIESQRSIGDNIKITVHRHGQLVDLTAKLQPMPVIKRESEAH